MFLQSKSDDSRLVDKQLPPCPNCLVGGTPSNGNATMDTASYDLTGKPIYNSVSIRTKLHCDTELSFSSNYSELPTIGMLQREKGYTRRRWTYFVMFDPLLVHQIRWITMSKSSRCLWGHRLGLVSQIANKPADYRREDLSYHDVFIRCLLSIFPVLKVFIIKVFMERLHVLYYNWV